MFDIVTWPRYLFKRYYLRQSVKKEKTSFLVSGDLTCFNINIESRYLLGIFTIRGKFCFKLLGQVNKFWISVIREFISVSEWCWQENSSSIFLRFMHFIANSQNASRRGCFPVVHFVTYVTYQTAEQLLVITSVCANYFKKNKGCFYT